MCEQRHRCGLAGLTKIVQTRSSSSPSPKRPVSPCGPLPFADLLSARPAAATGARRDLTHVDGLAPLGAYDATQARRLLLGEQAPGAS